MRNDELTDVCDWFDKVLVQHKRKITELMIRVENLEAGLGTLRGAEPRDAMKKAENGKIRK